MITSTLRRRLSVAATIAALTAASFVGAIPAANAALPTITSTLQVTKAWTAGNLAYGDGLFATAQGRVAAGTQWSHTYALYEARTDRKGYFQEYRAGRWVNLQTIYFKKTAGYKATVKTPLTNETVTRKYRVTVVATALETAWTSASVKIAHINPADYTGYLKASYNYMKAYCPNQVITLKDGTWSSASYPSLQIQMAQTYGTGKGLQYVSLHECAHIISFKLYADNPQILASRMAAIYGNSPSGMEQLADCMAFAMGADRSIKGTYTSNCTGARGTAAKNILAGKKA